MFDDVQFAIGRLRHTIVMKDGCPIYIENIDGREMFYRKLPKGGVEHCDFVEGCIDLTPIQLGYINRKGDCKYVCRMPKRRWKQGLDTQGAYYILKGRVRQYNIMEAWSALTKTIKNKYPSIDKCVESCLNGTGAMAFCRTFCLRPYSKRQLILEYMGEEIGHLNVEEGSFCLYPQYRFIYESLMEEL